MGVTRTAEDINGMQLAACARIAELAEPVGSDRRSQAQMQGFLHALEWAAGQHVRSPVRGIEGPARPVDLALEWTAAMQAADNGDAWSYGVAQAISWIRNA